MAAMIRPSLSSPPPGSRRSPGSVRRSRSASGGLGSSRHSGLAAKPHPAYVSASSAKQTALGYSKDPYGRMTKVQGDKDTVFGFTGHFWHAQSGLNLTLFRAHDPNMGRWINRDPIAEKGGFNVYRYAFGNPINLIDPLGLSCTPRDFAFDGLGLALGIGAVLFPEVAVAIGIVGAAAAVINHFVAPSPGFSGVGVGMGAAGSAAGVFGGMGGTSSGFLNAAGEIASGLGDAIGVMGIAVSVASTAVDAADCINNCHKK